MGRFKFDTLQYNGHSLFLQVFICILGMGTFEVVQEGPVNALALNRDNTQVAIGGRNGNQVLFTKHHNLITGLLQFSKCMRSKTISSKKSAISVLQNTSTSVSPVTTSRGARQMVRQQYFF